MAHSKCMVETKAERLSNTVIPPSVPWVTTNKRAKSESLLVVRSTTEDRQQRLVKIKVQKPTNEATKR